MTSLIITHHWRKPQHCLKQQLPSWVSAGEKKRRQIKREYRVGREREGSQEREVEVKEREGEKGGREEQVNSVQKQLE